MLNYGPAVFILFSIFIGILLNRRDYSLLREDMNRRFAELKADFNLRFEQVDRRFEQVDRRLDQVEKRLSLIETDQKQFFRTTGIIDGRLDELSARVK